MAGWGDDETPPEIEDSPAILDAKLQSLCELLSRSKYTVVYTGAGISTASGIPDYRGSNGLQNKRTPLVVLGLSEQKELDFVMPTYSHVALTRLVERGHVQFICTSNHDGLHQKAGTPDENVADIFGNVYVEKCGKCKRYWRRKVIVPTLGRRCDDPACGGPLKKTGTRMGGETPPEPLERGVLQSKKADLAIVLGSSLLVSPFCNLPFLAKKAVVVTLQETPYDKQAALKISSRCDVVTRKMLEHYGVSIGTLQYRQKYTLHWSPAESRPNYWRVEVKGDTSRPTEPPRCVERVSVRSCTVDSAEGAEGGQDGSGPAGEKDLDCDDRTGEFSGEVGLQNGHTGISVRVTFHPLLDPTGKHAYQCSLDVRSPQGASGVAEREFSKEVFYE